MLIRTQDKDILVNIDNIYAIAVSDDGMIRAIKSPDDNYAANLGNYSTKEKALKVLDMMGTAYERDATLDYDTHNYANGSECFCEYYTTKKVFQMPQDEEVAL